MRSPAPLSRFAGIRAPLRILHVVKKVPPVVGGDATAVAALAGVQRRAGHTVEVLTYDAPGVEPAPGIHRVGPRQAAADLDRITFRRVRAMAAMRRWARAHVTRDRFDAVHAHAVDVGAAVGPVARDSGVPVVLTCHGVWFPTRGPVAGWLERFLIRRARASALTTVDPTSGEALRSGGFADVEIVPNGVDAGEFAIDVPQEPPFRFLFVGRHEPQKGIDILLSATARCRELVDGPFLVELAGDGSLTARLREETWALGLESVVRFLGPLKRDALVRAYRSADVFVLASRAEGFPIAILEAWAAGLPVVASRVGGIPGVCDASNAVLVPPGDVEALAAAMADLYTDPEKRVSLGRAGQDVAKTRFSWESITQEYERIYRAVGAGGTR